MHISFKNKKIYEMLKAQSEKQNNNDMKNIRGVIYIYIIYIYMMICIKCKREGKLNRYIGETGRSVRERVKEHTRIGKNRANTTAVAGHIIERHDGEGINE